MKYLFAIIVFTAMSTITYSAPKVVESPDLKKIDQIVQAGLDNKAFPGAVVVVGQPEKTLWAKPYGRFTYEADSPEVKMDTLWDLASVSKVAGTATAAFVLMGDGKISINQRVGEYFPEFGYHGKRMVRLRHLMTHTSGLPAYASPSIVEKTRKEGEANADALVRFYGEMTPKYRYGEGYTYSCLNMQTMARVNEIASGQRQEDLLKQRVWGPLGMNDTGYVLTEEQIKRTAPTAKGLQGKVHDPIASYHGSEGHCPGNAGVFSTGPDLAKFCDLVLSDGQYKGQQIIKKDVIQQSMIDYNSHLKNSARGLGWNIYESKPYVTALNKTPETLIVGHGGFTGTMIWLDKLSKTYIVILTNRVYPNGKPEDAPGPTVFTVQQQIADTVLRSLPEYKDQFTD